jgi:hypothetical protein
MVLARFGAIYGVRFFARLVGSAVNGSSGQWCFG